MKTNLKIALLLAFIMAIGSSVFGQNMFNKRGFISYTNVCNDIFVSDTCYVTLGINIDSTTGFYQLLFASFDLNGNLQYKKTYSDTSNFYYSGIQNSAAKTVVSSGYAYCSSITDTSSDPSLYDNGDILLVKYNSVGDTVFTRRYNYGHFDVGYAVVETAEGGFLLCGTSETGLSTSCGRLIKTDSLGNVEWTQTYNCNFRSYLTKIIKTNDGGYCMAGEIQQGNQFSYFQTQVIKVDNNGNQQWLRYFGGPFDEYSPAISKLYNEDILVTGMYTNQQGPNPLTQYENILYILKLDINTGLPTLERNHGEDNNIILPYFNYENTDGTIILGGMTYGWIDHSIFDAREMGFLMKLTEDGDTIWFKKYFIDTTNVAFAEFASGKPTPDGGTIICGRETNYGGASGGGTDTWLIKTDANGCIDLSCVNGLEELDDEDFKLSIYPNPAENYVSIDLPIMHTTGTLQIYNMQGQLVKSAAISTGGTQSFSIADMPNGIYNLVVYSGTNKLLGREKLVVVR